MDLTIADGEATRGRDHDALRARARDSAPEAPLPSNSAYDLSFGWLIRLRWAAIVGQVLILGAAGPLLHVELPLGGLAGMVGFEVLTNVVARRYADRSRLEESAVAGLMALDVVILTVLLYLTGGPANPFSMLYLVYVALSASVLGARWTWVLVALSLTSLGVMYNDLLWLPPDRTVDPMGHMRMHLNGMWAATAVSAGFIAVFVTRTRAALVSREAELARAEASRVRAERLASLATLAAGAAHELSTPLGTILLAAGELERALRTGGDPQEMAEDASLIRGEVERCRAILDRLSAEAGERPGEAPRSVPLREVLEATVGLVGPRGSRVRIEGTADRAELPADAVAHALLSLVDNALDAAPEGSPVVLRGVLAGERVHLVVEDRGGGMPPEVLARASEPFYTTKETGRGMGLGLFLARTVAEQLGGSLILTSTAGEGTTATLDLPRTARGLG